MTTELISPTLAEVGEAIFGPAWREVLAYEFDGTEEDILSWEVDSSKMPSDIEVKLQVLAAGQIELIRTLLGQMEVTGLRGAQNQHVRVAGA